MLQIKKVLKVKDADGEFMDLPVLTGAPGQKGDKGDTGAKGDAGSDANVTAQNIASALGYTPIGTETDPTVPDWAKAESKPTYQANEIAVGDTTVGAVLSEQSAEIAELQTGKQDKLTAGENITIVGNVISASGGGGGSAAYEKVADVSISTSGETIITLSRAIRLTDVYITIINKTGNASSISNPQISPIKSDNSAFGTVYYTGNQGRCAVHITGFPGEIVALSTYHNAGYGSIQAVPNITWAMNNATDITAFKFSQVNANTQIKIYVR